MKAILFGALLALLVVLCPAALPVTAAAVAGQPIVLAFVLGVLTRPALGRRRTR
ncbi:hypothetical protein ACH3XX_42350 [Streptomyces scabiei]|jgi:cobalamin biosynthesis protein CobD/CbiB|uniref:hypothetical protein n=1 Tax=Streptomyces TaxID=1883 RepID=UPI000A419220|nr:MULTISPECIES: hypothetical protein [Streptomyces]MDX3207784.1 hypothetical protein [Streptomyces scabiei]MDX3839030.1 hypothetical protein [Streptomyces europaeiscabiei]